MRWLIVCKAYVDVLGGMSCLWGCVYEGTNAKVFLTKTLLPPCYLTSRGNIGVISRVILLKCSFSHDS